MRRFPRICGHPGCVDYTIGDTSRCARHQLPPREVRQPWRWIYSDRRYLAARDERYKRARGRCEDCGIRVGRGQWECDHVRAVVDGGDPFAVSNMRVRCVVPRTGAPRGCHGLKTRADRERRRGAR